VSDSREAGAKAFRERWTFTVVCRSCGLQFELEHPNVGLDCQPGFWRLCVVHVPEVCGECKSLRVVGEPSPGPSEPEGPASA
jgi:hypothetical protein